MPYLRLARVFSVAVALTPALLVAGCGSSSPASTNPDGATPTPDMSVTTAESLLLSEVRTHGAGGDGWGDDYIELYNAGEEAITLDATWKVQQQSAQGAACQGVTTNFMGMGQVIPPHGHLLLGGWEYGMFDATTPAADAPLLHSTMDVSLADAGAIWVVHGTKVIDALCFYYSDMTLAYLGTTCAMPYVCEGTPVSNLPHDGSSQATSSVNASLERLPGAAGGLQDTGDNATDFHVAMPATPQNLLSALTP